MNKKAILGCCIILLLTLLSGCGGGASESIGSLSGDAKTAADYVKAQGFEIQSYKGETSRYILDRKKLSAGMQIWSVQNEEPDNYFGQEIVAYGFIVDHHPLEKLYSAIGGEGEFETVVEIMVSNGRVIGGYSAPQRKDGQNLAGSVYSLDGKDVEAVKGMRYSEWLEYWKKKYGDSADE